MVGASEVAAGVVQKLHSGYNFRVFGCGQFIEAFAEHFIEVQFYSDPNCKILMEYYMDLIHQGYLCIGHERYEHL